MGLVIVSGAIANRAFKAGEAWHRLSWVLGLRRLGWDVVFVEQIGRGCCVDGEGSPSEFAESINLAYFQEVALRFGLEASSSLIYEDGEQTFGLGLDEMLDVAAEAELLINISGHLRFAPLLARARRKVYIDEDPGFTQFWYADGHAGLDLESHDFHFTIGENIGTPGCSIPTGEIHWHATRPIVVLDEWPFAPAESLDRFTTVAGWRGPYGTVAHGGRTYGLKVHEFRKFIELPNRSGLCFELALDIDPADQRDLDLLKAHGWHVVEPKQVAPDPDSFRRYVALSGAEFSVAKGVYVETGSGWFSDRTVRYLASGKPVLVQDTGFSRNLPVGEGLVAFRTMDEAVAGALAIARDYERHCRAARRLAETYFDSDIILGRLLEDVGLKP